MGKLCGPGISFLYYRGKDTFNQFFPHLKTYTFPVKKLLKEVILPVYCCIIRKLGFNTSSAAFDNRDRISNNLTATNHLLNENVLNNNRHLVMTFLNFTINVEISSSS